VAGLIGLLNATVKPVAVEVNDVTVRPRAVITVPVPVTTGLVALRSAAVTNWLPAVFRVTVNA